MAGRPTIWGERVAPCVAVFAPTSKPLGACSALTTTTLRTAPSGPCSTTFRAGGRQRSRSRRSCWRWPDCASGPPWAWAWVRTSPLMKPSPGDPMRRNPSAAARSCGCWRPVPPRDDGHRPGAPTHPERVCESARRVEPCALAQGRSTQSLEAPSATARRARRPGCLSGTRAFVGGWSSPEVALRPRRSQWR